jgi:hypothetical protein
MRRSDSNRIVLKVNGTNKPAALTIVSATIATAVTDHAMVLLQNEMRITSINN